MKTENKTTLTLAIRPSDVQYSNYGDVFNCAITCALSSAGRTDLIDVGNGIRTLDHKRFEDYNMKGYKAMRSYVLGQYRNKRRGKSARNKMKEFVIEIDESVYSSALVAQVHPLIAKIRKLFNKNK